MSRGVVRSGSPLSTAIREASQGEIEGDDSQSQLEFIRADLGEAPLLMIVKARLTGEEPRLLLRGHHLLYALRQYRHPRPLATPSWDFAFSEITEPRAPAPVNLINSTPLDPTSIDVMSTSTAYERFPLLRGKLRSWEELRSNLIAEEKVPSGEERVHRALTLTQFLDALFAAAEVFPVEIIEGNHETGSEDGGSLLLVRPRPDPDREALSSALNLRPLARRFEAALQVGVNYQFSNVVVGIEGDFDWFANNNNSGAGMAIATGPAAGSVVQGSNNGRWLTTVTGRVGLAADRLLGYIKGGGAWVGSNNLTLTNLSSGGSVSIGNGNTNTGWVAGAGLEWAFANNWTAKIEYDYVGLSDKSTTVTIPGIGPDTFSTNNRNVQMVTVGVNYLFNFGNY